MARMVAKSPTYLFLLVLRVSHLGSAFYLWIVSTVFSNFEIWYSSDLLFPTSSGSWNHSYRCLKTYYTRVCVHHLLSGLSSINCLCSSSFSIETYDFSYLFLIFQTNIGFEQFTSRHLTQIDFILSFQFISLFCFSLAAKL